MTKKTSIKALSLAALGVVYGDIGTSPLYTLKECFSAENLMVTPQNVYGFLSLIFWAIMVAVTLKYIIFIMQADNKGEGGIIVILQQACSQLKNKQLKIIMFLGLVGAALFYGDVIITPAMSVLSASEGLILINPAFEKFILPIAITVLLALFIGQRFGTQRVGLLFGPIMLLWFLTLGALGLCHIIKNPEILRAANPYYAYAFIHAHGFSVFLGLGAVVLALTGAEALYADMGHFGKKPIRLAWFSLVLPCLLLNYFGQGALLISDPGTIENPFFHLMPKWGILPLVLLATFATIIASQAVLSGAYSLTRQAIQLGFAPSMKIIHTSDEEAGQIYLPAVNWLLLCGIVLVIIIFKSSSNLAAAYGLAVTGTMFITSLLFCIIMIKKWHWPKYIAYGLTALFLCFDLVFFSANLLKITHGGWLPIMIAGGIMLVFITWKQGHELVEKQLNQTILLTSFLKSLNQKKLTQIDGTAIFLTSNGTHVPHALMQNIKHNKVCHERIILLTIQTQEAPYIHNHHRIQISQLPNHIANHFYTITAHYGYKETPNMRKLCQLINDKGLYLDIMNTSFFLSYPNISPYTTHHHFGAIRLRLFIWLNKNRTHLVDYLKIPDQQVIEIRSQLSL